MVENNKRKLWLDSLRGIAMLMVIFGHSAHDWTMFFYFTSPVKMPLFFIISAYVFNPRNGEQQRFLKNLLLKLVMPWLILGMVPFFSVDRFLNLLSGEALWFMPCLIIAEIIWFYINKFSKSSGQIAIYGLLSCVLGFVLHYHHLLRYAMIDTAFIVQIFFVVGYFIRQNEDFLIRRWKIWTPVAMAIYVILGGANMLFWPGEIIDVHLNIYYNIPICFFTIGIGCVGLFTLFKVLNVSPNWLVFIGQNTLVIYIFHGFFVGRAFTYAMNCLGIPSINIVLLGAIKTVIACCLCCLIAMVANKYFPKLVGK